jgi:tRNA 2-thiocytidine biosynthesis protein TtcA
VTAREPSLLARIRRLNKQHRLVEAGDTIMVACSGGKDSWALLHLMHAYRRLVPFDFDIVAMTLDQGHPGFDTEVIRAHSAAHGFRHHIEFADTITVVKAETPEGKIYCSLCSRMRRGILHRVAAQLGANKIALGHHRDDVIETVLLNMMFAGQIRAMPPLLPPENGGAAVIRPLASTPEVDLALYAADVGAPILPCNLCGSQPDTQRPAVKQLLRGLERDNPRVKDNLFAALAHVRPESLFDPALLRRASSLPLA